jgi:hypothetical protein
MTGVPIERRFALLVSFVGDIAQELATAEGCRRNPQAGIASRRRETVDRALQVFSSASRDVIGQRFPGTTGTPRRSGHQHYSRTVVPALPAECAFRRTRLPIEVESLAEKYNAERSANR